MTTAVLRKPRKMDVYAQVLAALMLRDMRTRFGGSHWGYFVVVMWPVAHIFLLVAIMVFRGMPAPMGGDAILFVSTGAVPALMFQYISSEVMKSVVMNKPLIYYPQVKIFDVMLARLIVEVVKGFTGLIVVFAILLSLGVDPVPVYPPAAIGGYCAAILLGIGAGAVNIGIVAFFPGWMLGYVLVRITLYLSSGVFFLPHLFPNEIYSVMKWNPLVQIIEWVRLGYEPALGVEVDYVYVLLWGGVLLLIGLLMERTIVRRMN